MLAPASLREAMKHPIDRRLAAILAADVAGYSRLMGADEEGTHERLKAVRRQLVDPKITEHHGRIVKTTGDGLLAEFASVVDAVRCAAEVQRGMIDREPELPGERRRSRAAVGPMVAGAAAVLIFAVIAWWLWPATRSSPTPSVAAAPVSISRPALAPRLSIVVLPSYCPLPISATSGSSSILPT